MKKTLGLLTLIALVCGCKSTAPTAFERKFVDVTTNYIPHIEVVTNIVTVPVTNFLQVTSIVTNQVGVTVPVTNFVPVIAYTTNVVTATVTNQVPQYSETLNSTTKTAAAVAGTASNLVMPGIGSLVGMGLLGLGNILVGIRNRQLSGKNDALSQGAGTLSQIIETGMEVMKGTPQGADAANAFKSWMVSHQAATGTIAQISQIVQTPGVVNNEQAQAAAAKILELIGPVQPPAPSPAPTAKA